MSNPKHGYQTILERVRKKFVGKKVRIFNKHEFSKDISITVAEVEPSSGMRKDVIYFLRDDQGESIPIGPDTKVVVLKENNTE